MKNHIVCTQARAIVMLGLLLCILKLQDNCFVKSLAECGRPESKSDSLGMYSLGCKVNPSLWVFL